MLDIKRGPTLCFPFVMDGRKVAKNLGGYVVNPAIGKIAGPCPFGSVEVFDRAVVSALRTLAGSGRVNRHGRPNPSVAMVGVRQSGIEIKSGTEGLRDHTAVRVLSIAK